MKRILGLDLGNRSLGVALSDENRIVVRPLETFFFKNRDFLKAAQHVVSLCLEYDVDEVVLGNPILTHGEEGSRSNITRKFKAMILKINPDLEIHLVDERYTSLEASKVLKENHKSHRESELIDGVAACLILERFLSKIK